MLEARSPSITAGRMPAGRSRAVARMTLVLPAPGDAMMIDGQDAVLLKGGAVLRRHFVVRAQDALTDRNLRHGR